MSKKVESVQSIQDVVSSQLFGQKAVNRLIQCILTSEHDDNRVKNTTVALLDGKEAEFQLIGSRSLNFLRFIDHEKLLFIQLRSASQTVFCSQCKRRRLKKHFKLCSRCKSVYYCGDNDGACQVANWDEHKRWCKAAGCLPIGKDTHVEKKRVGPSLKKKN